MVRRNNTAIISFPSPPHPDRGTSAGHLSLHTPDRSLIHSCSTYYYVRPRTCDDDCRVIIVVFFRFSLSSPRTFRTRNSVVVVVVSMWFFFHPKTPPPTIRTRLFERDNGATPCRANDIQYVRWPSPFLYFTPFYGAYRCVVRG